MAKVQITPLSLCSTSRPARRWTAMDPGLPALVGEFWKVPVTVAGRLKPPLSTARLLLFPYGSGRTERILGALPLLANECSPLRPLTGTSWGGSNKVH